MASGPSHPVLSPVLVSWRWILCPSPTGHAWQCPAGSGGTCLDATGLGGGDRDAGTTHETQEKEPVNKDCQPVSHGPLVTGPVWVCLTPEPTACLSRCRPASGSYSWELGGYSHQSSHRRETYARDSPTCVTYMFGRKPKLSFPLNPRVERKESLGTQQSARVKREDESWWQYLSWKGLDVAESTTRIFEKTRKYPGCVSKSAFRKWLTMRSFA